MTFSATKRLIYYFLVYYTNLSYTDLPLKVSSLKNNISSFNLLIFYAINLLYFLKPKVYISDIDNVFLKP